jgi:hypothetical protein
MKEAGIIRAFGAAFPRHGSFVKKCLEHVELLELF